MCVFPRVTALVGAVEDQSIALRCWRERRGLPLSEELMNRLFRAAYVLFVVAEGAVEGGHFDGGAHGV